MNEVIIKRTIIFSLIFGAIAGIAAVLPFLTALCFFVVMISSAPIVILYMKHEDKYLGIVNNEESAILGGIIGFFTMIGFFLSFTPLVCIAKFIFKSYYPFMIPDMLSTALWLFFILVLAVASFFAATNAVSAMALSWVYRQIKKSPDENNTLDMKIED